MHSPDLVPQEIKTKTEFWAHVATQLQHLLDGQRNWVTNTASASSLIYFSLQAFPAFFGPDETKAVNWVGVYIDSKYCPPPKDSNSAAARLLLGPFCGKPACQFINVNPEKKNPGVCADGFIHGKSLLVPDVDQYPGHIACFAATKSEIVCPLFDGKTPVGVLDLDCLALGGFDEEDKIGLDKCAEIISESSDWTRL
ncbi:gaf domain nucleotide-binding protein [Moniliophthora roreri MCA 2997]|uniref:Gaf domain nucleotide-binding protein n=2 Tax=Moniliophthora roreri TaxID=221103 RepID=V2XEF7_MONRO|nr:gaf domain nucleotide-binding protein [Moniliophthora roreri MCA 2997]KAI3604543.1 gaf domain nucleotide-binding protein [Moniliophthora roreri]